MVTQRLFLAGLRVLILTALAVPAEIDAQRRLWQPDDRTLVSDGGTVTAIAAGNREVFGATPWGLLVRDIVRDRWLPPLALPIELIATRITAAAWDPAGGAVWLGTDGGDLFTTTPGMARWDRVPAAGRGAIDALVPWPREGAVYARSAGGWTRVASGSFFVDPAGTLPPGVQEAASDIPADPFFAAAAGSLTLDPGRRRWPITDVASGPDPGLYWVATNGGGIVRFDSRTNRRDWLRYGLAGTGAGSVATIGGGLWFGGDGRGARRGVASSDPMLQDWRQFDQSEGAPAGFVAEIVEHRGRVWFAAADGLYSMDPRSSGRGAWRRMTSADGLPSDRVRSLASAGSSLWAGTDQGAVALDSTGAAGPILSAGRRVSRIAIRGNDVLLATDGGLLRLPHGSMATRPERASPDPALGGRVTDVVVAADGVYAIANGEVRTAGSTPAVLRDPALDRIGDALRLSASGDRLWVAGPRGIAHRDPATGTWEAFTVPEDIPAGPVTDVLQAGDDVWVATPAGAVRLRWR